MEETVFFRLFVWKCVGWRRRWANRSSLRQLRQGKKILNFERTKTKKKLNKKFNRIFFSTPAEFKWRQHPPKKISFLEKFFLFLILYFLSGFFPCETRKAVFVELIRGTRYVTMSATPNVKWYKIYRTKETGSKIHTGWKYRRDCMVCYFQKIMEMRLIMLSKISKEVLHHLLCFIHFRKFSWEGSFYTPLPPSPRPVCIS